MTNTKAYRMPASREHQCTGYRPRPDEFSFTDHRHKCMGCGVVWHHHPANIPASHEAFVAAHSCPGCGMQQQFVHDGPEAADVCNWDGREAHRAAAGGAA